MCSLCARLYGSNMNYRGGVLMWRVGRVQYIRRAYKALAVRFHPDKTAGDGAALMAAVNDAFNTLNDPARRRAYDEGWRARRRAAERRCATAGGAHDTWLP